MTINVALVTSEALILGCDSIASSTAPMIQPFAKPFAVDTKGDPLLDADGNPLVSVTDIQDVVTGVSSGVTKMFEVCGQNETVVAATTAGMAKLNGRLIASLAREFFEKERARPFATVSAVANSFLRFFRKEYETDQKASGLPPEYWSGLEFLVGGFGKHSKFPALYRIKVKKNTVTKEFQGGECGLSWAGQADTVERLIRGYDSNLKKKVEQHIGDLMDKHHKSMSEAMVKMLDDTLKSLGAAMPKGVKTRLPKKPATSLGWGGFHMSVDYPNLPLQDAIDFVSFLAIMQSGRQKFSTGFATVGGRIHIGISRKGEKFSMLNEPILTHDHTGFIS